MATPPYSSATVDVRGIGKRYEAGAGACRATVDALSDVSLVLRSGEAVVVAGPAGSGKTTLLLCAAGLLRHERGEIVVRGDWQIHYWDLARWSGCPPLSRGGVWLLDGCDDVPTAERPALTCALSRALARGGAVALAARDA